MPADSVAQLRAMYAAKSGKSTLGIPKSVGADFVAATPSAKGHKFGKAMQHHAKIGAALQAGDGQTAMKHIGHMMLATRAAMAPQAPAQASVQAPNDDQPVSAVTPPTSLRQRLASLRGR